jgi:hypothetical protein
LVYSNGPQASSIEYQFLSCWGQKCKKGSQTKEHAWPLETGTDREIYSTDGTSGRNVSQPLSLDFTLALIYKSIHNK